MSMLEEMHRLTQTIMASREARVAGVGEIQRATQSQLRQLNRDHQAMARQQRATLAGGRADLARGMATQLKEADAAHQAMARQQRATLAKGRTDLARGMATQLKEADAAHQAMARQQRATLDKGRTDLARGMATQLKELTEDHAGAQREWQGLVATLQVKRVGGLAVAEAAAPAPPQAPAAPMAPPPPIIEEMAEEEAVARAVVGAVTAELADLGDEVFPYLASHPDGARLVELEQEFGIGRLQMARVVRKLIDDGKVEKQGLLYFAA